MGLKLSVTDSSDWLLLAQEAATDPPGGGSLFPELPIPLLFMVFIALFYFMLLKPQQNKDKKFRSMLDGLKEKDRVVTIGGIHGVVTNVQRDREEVTLRVDESTGAKLRVGMSAIAKLVTDETKDDKKTK